MNMRRIVGIALAIIGVVLICISVYISNQVASGQEQISSAKQKVNTVDTLFSVTPESKQIGQGITNSANKKIKQGEQQVSYYSQLSGRIQIGGIVLIILGAVVFFFPQKRR